MNKLFLTLLFVFICVTEIAGNPNFVIADSASRMPLPSASVFNRNGTPIGVSTTYGKLPYITRDEFPITIRYLGYKEKEVGWLAGDTIFMTELPTGLEEVIIESKQQKLLHILAYVREYSSLSTYTDTVFLFREKMVDFMYNPDNKSRFKEWLTPRIIKSDSYYRFTNNEGLDSVSSKCSRHFSWSDWMEVVLSPSLPDAIRGKLNATDTLRGKYGPSETWVRNNDKVVVDVNVLADTTGRKWVANLSSFFQNYLDFENFRVSFKYENVADDVITPTDLAGYSFLIESNGRGHEMFGFNNKRNETSFVSTFGEVYILDREYITLKEARKWEKRKFDTEGIDFIVPPDMPELQPAVRELVNRVKAIDHIDVRLATRLDPRLVSNRKPRPQHLGERALVLLKNLVGITDYKSRKKFNERWTEIKKSQIQKNKRSAE